MRRVDAVPGKPHQAAGDVPRLLAAAKAQRLNRRSRLGMRIRPRRHFTNQSVGPATAFELLISMLPAAASVAFGLAKRRMNLCDGRPCARAV